MLQGYGHLLGKSIHSHGKGEVRHGKNGTSLGRTRGIEMMGMQRHGANGMAWLRQADLTSGSLRGKSIGSKSRTDLLQCWHKAFLPFRQCYVFSCIKLAQARHAVKGHERNSFSHNQLCRMRRYLPRLTERQRARARPFQRTVILLWHNHAQK